jgi:hypothetical protein
MPPRFALLLTALPCPLAAPATEGLRCERVIAAAGLGVA